MAWLTNKETGGVFNTDWMKEEETKEKQIAKNKEEADKRNSKKGDTPKYTKRSEGSYVLGDPNKMGPKINIQRSPVGRITGGGNYWYLRYGIQKINESYEKLADAKKAGIELYNEYKQKGIL